MELATSLKCVAAGMRLSCARCAACAWHALCACHVMVHVWAQTYLAAAEVALDGELSMPREAYGLRSVPLPSTSAYIQQGASAVHCSLLLCHSAAM